MVIRNRYVIITEIFFNFENYKLVYCGENEMEFYLRNNDG
jgi:hypothetical protein